jgi:DHA2 family multidrug resistance protein
MGVVIAARLGRTRAFTLAIALFTLTSAMCAMATTLPQIVLFRALQGATGSLLVPMAQAMLLDAYPRHEMQRAMSIFSTGVMVGPILGPIVGGYLTQAFSWRWCFYINVPIGIFCVIGTVLLIPETTKAPDRKLDWLGFGFLSLAVGAFQMLLDRGEHKGWFESSEILVEAALAIFGLYMFIVHSATTKHPFIDMRLLRDRTFVSGTAIMGLIFMIYLGAMVLVPQLLQFMFNYPVLTAGLATSPRGIGMMLAIMAANRMHRLVSPKAIIALGLILNGLALYMMSRWSLVVGMDDIVWTGALQGAGIGFITMPAATASFSTLTDDLRTDGTAFFNLMRNLGGAVGVAIVSSRVVELTQIHHSYLAEFMTPFRHSGPTMPAHGMPLDMLNLGITQQAAMIAYINSFLMLGITSVAMVPIVFLLRTPRHAHAGPPNAVMAD